MTTPDILALAATTGGVLLGVSPVLQMRLIIARRSSEGVSVGYWAILIAAMSLWLAYGVSIGNWAMIVANAVSVTVAAVMVAVAYRYRTPASPST